MKAQRSGFHSEKERQGVERMLYRLPVKQEQSSPVSDVVAEISTAVNESVVKIEKWLGVNQSPEGESRLRTGEAADMRNFRISAGGALQKRPGSRNVAGLQAGYVVSVDESTTEVLMREAGSSSAKFAMYPYVAADSLGKLILSGEAVEVSNAVADRYIGYYFKDSDGKVHKFAGLLRTSEVNP